MLRTFIAVDVSAIDPITRLQNEIGSAAKWSNKDVKLIEPQNFHFTLIFLGEISDSNVDRIQSKLSGLRFDAIDLSYNGVGAFPRLDAARIVWVGVDREGSQRLTDVADKVSSAVSELGFKPDKPFSPHLTIFRVKARQPVDLSGLARKYDGFAVRDRIDKIHLKKSELTPAGPVYSNIYTVEAGK
ncbi:MAG TPA: RNA 2',3'-cyclic phosphodiesterase [Nitrososphaera sp.]|nr:RNA 2',3'-cyclic phosphodiesterase [Nitrososphaera sp.]